MCIPKDKLSDVVFVYKILKKEVPETMIEQFQISENVRYQISIVIITGWCWLNLEQTPWSAALVIKVSAKVWNTLPLSLKQEPIAVDDFKSKLKMNLDSELLVNLDY